MDKLNSLWLMVSGILVNQHWFRQWLGAWRHQAITWTMLTDHQWDTLAFISRLYLLEYSKYQSLNCIWSLHILSHLTWSPRGKVNFRDATRRNYIVVIFIMTHLPTCELTAWWIQCSTRKKKIKQNKKRFDWWWIWWISNWYERVHQLSSSIIQMEKLLIFTLLIISVHTRYEVVNF